MPDTATDLTPACWTWPAPTDETRQAARADLIGRNASGLLPDPGMVAEHLVWIWQAGRCALCGRPSSTETWSDLVADLDEAEQVRGYVCDRCENTTGDADNDERWARYLDRTPAQICGVHG